MPAERSLQCMICCLQNWCGLLPLEPPVIVAARPGLFLVFCFLFFSFLCIPPVPPSQTFLSCLCSEGYLRQACGCLVDPDDVQQQAVSVLGSLDVQPHLCWCSGFLHSPGWHAALQQCLEPTPILQTIGSSSPAVWHTPIVEVLARVHGPGWHAALQQCLEPTPILHTKGK